MKLYAQRNWENGNRLVGDIPDLATILYNSSQGDFFMPEGKWEAIDEVAGDIQAEMLRGLLEAQGFRVWLSQEGAGRAYGLTLSTLGAVQILVPSESAARARQVLDDYYAGRYEKEDLRPGEPGPEATQNETGQSEDETPGLDAATQG
jgi:hypothetical protein